MLPGVPIGPGTRKPFALPFTPHGRVEFGRGDSPSIPNPTLAVDDWLDASDPNAFTPTRQLFGNWKVWAEQRNTKVGTERAFAQGLADKGYQQSRTEYSRGFNGIRLKPHDGSCLG